MPPVYLTPVSPPWCDEHEPGAPEVADASRKRIATSGAVDMSAEL